MLTSIQIDQLQHIFQLTIEDPIKISELFYGRLFEVAPEVRPMFKSDMKQQGRKLMQTLLFIVNNLHQFEEIIPKIHDLSKRHATYGVLPQHYTVVGDALLWTLANAFPNAWNKDVEQAWSTAYATVAKTAIESAYASE